MQTKFYLKNKKMLKQNQNHSKKNYMTLHFCEKFVCFLSFFKTSFAAFTKIFLTPTLVRALH